MTTTTSKGQGVQTVERAIGVLHALARSPSPMSALEVARAMQINRSIVHRTLRTLLTEGLAQEPRPGRYQLGPMHLFFGNLYRERLPVRRLGLPYLIDLSDRVTSHGPIDVALTVPVPTHVVVVERIWRSDTPVDLLLDVGARMSFTASAAGRTLLASSNDENVIELVGRATFEELAPRLKQIRERNLVDFSSGEFRRGVSAIAAAIGGNRSKAVGSVVLSGTGLERELHPQSALAIDATETASAIASVLDDLAV